MKKISAGGDQRWKVVAGDVGKWRVGVYRPENGSADEVKTLEKHTCVELFMLLEGRVSLLLRSDKGKEKTVELEPGFVYMIDEYHNGFRPGGANGSALVVERDTFSTTYIDRQGRKVKGARVVKGVDVK